MKIGKIFALLLLILMSYSVAYSFNIGGFKTIDGKTAQDWCGLGLNTERPESKIRCYYNAFELNVKLNNVMKPKVWSDRGSAYAKLGRYNEAIICYENALKADPKNVEYWFIKGNYYYRLKQYNDSLDCYNTALKIDPNYKSAKFMISIVETRFDEIQNPDKYPKIDGKTALQWEDLANNESSPSKKIEYIDNAITLEPNNSIMWSKKGVILHDDLKEYNESLKCFEKALELDPNEDIDLKNAGWVFYDLNDYQKALYYFEKALELDPTSQGAMRGIQMTCFYGRKYRTAIECCDKELELYPNSYAALVNKGNSYNERKEYKKALVCFDNALKLNPYHSNAWNGKGVALVGAYCADPWNNIMDAQIGILKAKEALRCHEKALELDPNNQIARYNKKALEEVLN
ncbi:tetratricopeptide repeat protein [Methanococcus vannielii]|nr:tetratricopeptide repeat protein [Methanococcus vannielii]